MAALSMVVGTGREFGTVFCQISILHIFALISVENKFCIPQLRSGRRDLYWELQAGQVFRHIGFGELSIEYWYSENLVKSNLDWSSFTQSIKQPKI